MSVLCVAGCGNDPSAPPTIGSAEEYASALTVIRRLSQSPIEKALADRELTDQERTDLKEAARLAEGIVAYNPDNGATHILVGQCRFALGEYESAANHLKQALTSLPRRVPGSLETSDTATSQVRAEAHALSARCYEKLRAFEQAKLEAVAALQLFPKNSEYACLVASADIQIGSSESIAEAKKLLQAVLNADPDHVRARQLGKLLGGWRNVK